MSISVIKKTIKPALTKLHLLEPLRFVKASITVTKGVIYDRRRFLKYSALCENPVNERQYFAIITKLYHGIEKGLALKETRPLFGKEVIRRTINLIEKYSSKYPNNQATALTLNSFTAYIEFHKNLDIQDPFLEEIEQVVEKYSPNVADIKEDLGGVYNLTREQILEHGKIDLANFFNSRYSVRNFSKENVDIEDLKKAIRLAQKTPNVCNRQSCKAYVFSKAEDIKKALSHQNGNRGFTDEVNKLIIIASDVNSFFFTGERFQRWIEGGMFAMSFIYALHSLGLGSCCLNWSVDAKIDKSFRQSHNIAPNDEIIMMIAVGHLDDTMKVCHSSRINDIDEMLIQC